ncbi:hypothetical protein N9B03_09150, partial [Akkermansiaceae bacterium]|nr:hypothetical protein [Akkermansiaceae bacterium]
MLQLLLKTSPVKVISLFGALVFNWLISLLLPVSDAGLLFAVLSITPGLAIFMSFGVDQTVLRAGTRRFADKGYPGLLEVMGYSARSILNRTVLVIVLSVPVALGLLYLLPQKHDLVLQWFLALAVAPFFAALLPGAMGYRVQGRYRRSVLSEPSAVMTFAALGFGMTCFLIEPQLWVAYAAYGLAIVALSLPLFRTTFTLSTAPVDHDRYFGINELGVYLLQWGIVAQVSFYATSEEIATISLSLRMVIMVNLVLILMGVINNNKISTYIQDGNDIELRSLLRQQFPILFWVGTGSAVVLGAFAPFGYGFLGQGYENAAGVTLILIVGQLVNVYTAQANILLNMSGNARTNTIISISVGG